MAERVAGVARPTVDVDDDALALEALGLARLHADPGDALLAGQEEVAFGVRQVAHFQHAAVGSPVAFDDADHAAGGQLFDVRFVDYLFVLFLM